MNNRHEFQTDEAPDGVTIDTTNTELCECDWIQVQDENGAEITGQPIGNYITIKTDILGFGKIGELDKIAETVSDYLLKIMNMYVSDDDSVLIVGIGNRNCVVDSLGVRVADKIVVTGHFPRESVELLGGGIRPVFVTTPGTTGCTGLNTAKTVKSICDMMKPSLVILIDALVARGVTRFCSSIQISDIGMTPGGGVQGKNAGQTINSDFLGVPVIGMGVPTVLNIATILDDYANELLQAHNIDIGDLEESLAETLSQYMDKLFPYTTSFITTKEIDVAIHYSTYILSTALNLALFQDDWILKPYIAF